MNIKQILTGIIWLAATIYVYGSLGMVIEEAPTAIQHVVISLICLLAATLTANWAWREKWQTSKN